MHDKDDYLEGLTENVAQKYRALELSIMRDVIRRIRKAKTITSTADWQIQRLVILGFSPDDVRDLVSEAVGDNQDEVARLYRDIIDSGYARDAALYKAVGKDPIPFADNLELQQLTQAMVDQAGEALHNITGSMGFMLPGPGGLLQYTTLSEIYGGYLDDAITGMVAGAYDYNTLVRRVTSQLTRSGLRSAWEFGEGGSTYGVDYASGRHNRLDVAARRAILTGYGQIAGYVSERNAEALNTDYFEISFHHGARPDHMPWQGRVYTRAQLATVCGLGLPGGLLGCNCRHEYYPFIPGVSQRNYDDRWLDRQNAHDRKEKAWNGKKYNTYDATQQQRRMETAMRAKREAVQLMRDAEADPDMIIAAQCQYQAMLDGYRDFSDAMGIDTQTERIYTGRTAGRIAPTKKQYSAWLAAQAAKRQKGAK